MSPILFALFFNELIKQINSTNTGIQWGSARVNCLLYADDIVILTKSPKKMQKCLDIVTQYGKRWRCTYNIPKSKVVIHGRRPAAPRDMRLDGHVLETVTAYKYLGLEVQRNMNWKKYKARALNKATWITTKIKAMFLKNNKII